MSARDLFPEPPSLKPLGHIVHCQTCGMDVDVVDIGPARDFPDDVCASCSAERLLRDFIFTPGPNAQLAGEPDEPEPLEGEPD